MTELLYLKDSYLKEINAVVIDCIKKEDNYFVELDKTIFFTECGSQPSDKGFIGDAYVKDMKKIDDRYFHICDKSLEIGKEYLIRIDFDRRFDFMQCHSGEALLSGVLYRKFGINQLSFHLNEHNLTIDVDERIEYEDCEKIIEEVSKQIFMNKKYLVHNITKNELCNFDIRRSSEEYDNIRLIEIENLDVSFCGGTHIKRTGELGGFTITKLENKKKGQRIFFIYGKRYLDYEKKNFKIMRFLNLKFNANIDNLKERINEKLNNYEQEKNKYINLEKDLIQMMKNNVFDNDYYIISKLDDEIIILNVFNEILYKNGFNLLINELIKICDKNETKKYILIAANAKEENASIVVYVTKNCFISANKILDDIKVKYNLKGGGNVNRSQIVVNKKNIKKIFIEIIENRKYW